MKKITLLLIMLFALTITQGQNLDSLEIYENDQFTSIKQVDNRIEHTTYFANGEIREVGYFNSSKQKDGKWVRYNESGDVVATAEYKDGKRVGVWKVWDLKGRLAYEITYKNNKQVQAYYWKENEGLMVRK